MDATFSLSEVPYDGGFTVKDTRHLILSEKSGLNGAEIADEYIIREMYKPRQYEKPGVWYGFGLETKMLKDMQVHQHGGSLPGASSNIAFSEEAGIAVIVLCNTMDVPVSAISDLIFKTAAGLPTEDQRPEHASCDWDEDFKHQIVGTYASGEGDTMKLSLENGGIAMTVNDKPTDMTPIYPREGLVRKTYSDMYLQFILTLLANLLANFFTFLSKNSVLLRIKYLLKSKNTQQKSTCFQCF